MLYSSGDYKPLHGDASSGVAVNVRKSSEAPVSSPKAQQVAVSNQKTRTRLDKCCRAINIVGGCLTLTTLVVLSGAIYKYGAEIPRVYSACSQAATTVEAAMPEARQIISDYPKMYNSTAEAIKAFNLIYPIVATIPDLMRQVDILIDDVENCTGVTPVQERVAAVAKIKRELIALSKVLAEQGVASKKVPHQKDPKLKSRPLPKKPYQVKPYKRGQMARAPKRGSQSKR
jgi:hypothetical protein